MKPDIEMLGFYDVDEASDLTLELKSGFLSRRAESGLPFGASC